MKLNRLYFQNSMLYLYFFLINMESLGAAGVFSISKLIGILYLIFIFPSFKIFFKIDKSNLKFFWPIFTFLLILIFNSIININSYSSKVFDVAIFLNVFIFIALVNHARKDNLALEKAIFAFALGSLFVSILMFLGIGAETSTVGRITIFGSNSNELGIKLATGLVVIVINLIFNSLKLGRSRLILMLFIPFLLFSIISTGSRSAIMVLFLSISIWTFLRFLNAKNKIISMFSTTFFLLFLLFPLIYFSLENEVLSSRINETLSQGDQALGGREIIWLNYISLFLSNPLFGYGFSGFQHEAYKLIGMVSSPHNVILEVLLYTGIFGTVFYIIFLFKIFYSAYLTQKNNNKILPILLIPSILAYVLANQALPVKFCWMLMAYIIGTYLINSQYNLLKK